MRYALLMLATICFVTISTYANSLIQRHNYDVKMVTRVYPVQDLLMEIPDFEAVSFTDISYYAYNATGIPHIITNNIVRHNTKRHEDLNKDLRSKQLIQMIKSNVDPEIWNNGGTIYHYDGNLIIKAPLKTHRKLR